VNTYLEVYGNCLLQERTVRYLRGVCGEMVEFVAGRTGGMLEGIVDLSNLKYREKDDLQSIFQVIFWIISS